jgi:Domain of unknown function (DUF4340)
LAANHAERGVRSEELETKGRSSPVVRRGVPGAGLLSLALAATLAVVLGILVVRTTSSPPTAVPRTPSRPLLLALAPESVRRVEVSRGDQVLRFERTGEGWRLGDGAEGLVPDDRVDQFLRTIAGLERLEQVADPGASLAEFGLDPPRALVVLSAGGESRIAIGERNPALTALYVQVAPDPHVVLVGAVLQWELDKLAALATVRHAP